MLSSPIAIRRQSGPICDRSRPHLLQAANVGTVVGGTGACAWTVTRALPGLRHTLGFFGPIAPETRRLIEDCDLRTLGRLEPRLVRELGVDLVLLHNTPAHRLLERLPAATLLYLHSYQTAPAPADVVIYCSRWLAKRYGADPRLVCHQGVPVPPGSPPLWRQSPKDSPSPSWGRVRVGGRRGRKRDRHTLVVGRLCTPTPRKWPPWTADFYRDLARAVPTVRWEFVGCPEPLQPELRKACRRRVRFHAASWSARAQLWNWDVLCYSNPELPESFGRVCAEAMRTGCVPVVDDQGGFREQVEDGRSGFLCGSPAEFAEALRRLQDPAVCHAVSTEARRRADQEFSVTAFARRLRRWMATVSRIW